MTDSKLILAKGLYDFLPNYYRYLNPIFNNETSASYKLSENQIKVIMCLFLTDYATPTAISETLGIHKGSMTAIIRSLVKMNLIEKVWKENDERSYQLVLTVAGLEFIDYKEKKSFIELESLFKDLNDEDHQKIIDGFEVLNNYLSQQSSERRKP